jgi:recombination protein RecA
MYNSGISRTGDVLDLAVEYGLIDKRGAYFRYDDLLLGQGRENAKAYLEENPELMDTLDSLVREAAGLQPRFLEYVIEDGLDDAGEIAD